MAARERQNRPIRTRTYGGVTEWESMTHSGAQAQGVTGLGEGANNLLPVHPSTPPLEASGLADTLWLELLAST